MAIKTLVIGCGYVGLPLALHWKDQGSEVSAWVRSPDSADMLAEHHFRELIVGSIAEAAIWETLSAYDRIVHCASSGGGGPDAYREVFLEGVRIMAAHQPGARKLLVSSTSVYGQTAGEIVTEESPAQPLTPAGRLLREAEDVALAANFIVVRSSGIYGPNRGALFEKVRRDEAVIEGDGAGWINQIHRQDLVDAILWLMEGGNPGQIYNATDDTPVTHREFYAWASDFLRKPMPSSGPVNPDRKRGLTNKRVSNAKLRALGWQPRYPSFREGLAQP
jgi:nucleoside-diphosphate-sugar epimerase